MRGREVDMVLDMGRRCKVGIGMSRVSKERFLERRLGMSHGNDKVGICEP